MLGPEVGTQSLSARNSDGICNAKRSVSYCVGPNGPWLTMTGRAGRVWWGVGWVLPRRLTTSPPRSQINGHTHAGGVGPLKRVPPLSLRRLRLFYFLSFHFAKKCDGNGNKRKVHGGGIKTGSFSHAFFFFLKNLFPPSRELFSLFALCNTGAGAHIMSSKYRSRRGGTDCVRRLARARPCARGA